MRYNTTKRDPIKNSFIMPNEIFRLGLSEGAIAVYAYLLYCEDRGTYQCYPSYTTIACAIGKSKNSIRKYVAELVSKRLIETEHTTVILKDGRKHNGSLKYTILPIDKAVRHHEEVQMRQLKIEEARREAEKRLAEYDRNHPKTEMV